ncbi:translation initiation factor IF-3 [bacterium]|nr:translation initiation factor IF-3 [candidate division CSSED10-310 bacterium]
MTDDCRINDQIKSRTVRCIDRNGNQIGVVPVEEALALADQSNLDLVEVAPGADPPVCRIMDYGKYKYQKSKRTSSKKQKGATLKEVKFRPKVDVHDYNFKRNHVERFLKAGAKVKVTIMFRGREMAHTDKGMEILQRVAREVEELARVDREPRLEGRNMFMILSPK